jgi:release factor glutamine methyltransferase
VIAVTLAAEYTACRVTALDVSPDAIAVARGNAEAHSVADRIEFCRSDLFESVEGNEKYDLFISNPPYIADSDRATLPPEVKADPRIALFGGADGLDVIRVIVREAPRYVRSGGRIMFEIGFNQSRAVAELCEATGLYEKVTIVKDLNEYDRIVILTPR